MLDRRLGELDQLIVSEAHDGEEACLLGAFNQYVRMTGTAGRAMSLARRGGH
ncbi:hypothetical protein [Conexibacter sp. CPCC 206217]|uniref:hypothetical protein n=1 Tax=Conexibacter sp. CPCC 206217 TaxID=3064574 RepID=UPI0027164F64|nr:hypothetical protein [Conexibacter sp. CPCC 206217]MDO8209082.1 hypothetical protein [Conexibacter sp. CPCC 206217]